MKLVVWFISAIIGFAAVSPASGRGCIYIDGQCAEQCPEGTYGYSVGCDYITPEATCENPNPEVDKRGIICDYSACYCESPTVRDTTTGKCVPLNQCPKTKCRKQKKPKLE